MLYAKTSKSKQTTPIKNTNATDATDANESKKRAP
jgi:hypothetical protein